MTMSYQYSESSNKPLEIEFNANSVFIRKNFSRFTRSENGIETEYWSYQEAKLSSKEFAEYADFLKNRNAIKGQNDSENIASLVISQSESEFNLLAAMEATADLYELMSTNEFNQLATMEAIADLYEAIATGGTT